MRSNYKSKRYRCIIFIFIFFILWSLALVMFNSTVVSAIGGAQTIRVATNRYSVFAPYIPSTQTNYDSDNSSFTFTAGALVIDANGSPLANTNITFNISANGTLKQSGTIATNNNGIAFFPYNTFKDFTSYDDPDYGLWNVTAYIASNPGISGTAYLNISILGGSNGTTVTGLTYPLGSCGSTHGLCHRDPTRPPNVTSPPRSPYSDNFGIANTTSMAYGAHIRRGSLHKINNSNSTICAICHIGLDREPLSTYPKSRKIMM